MLISTQKKAALDLLNDWAGYAERDWTEIPHRPGFGCYGTGYDGWGVQTLQKYLGAMAVLGTQGESRSRSGLAFDRAFSALRFNLASHVSGSFCCTDNVKWGHSWISALGIERMMHGVQLLLPHFTSEDHEGLRNVLCSEADWLLTSYRRGSLEGIVAGKWACEEKNDPESNLWNGALLWRAAQMYPDHTHAADWMERSYVFLTNAVSVPEDAHDDRFVAGKPLKDRHLGANFFSSYALDHHGYLNVGYKVICVSNAAILHFDLKSRGISRPEILDLHQKDLWLVLRRMIFADGRLARIGGDTRVRYAYCQDYLLPSLLYAADRLGEKHAPLLVNGQMRFFEKEAVSNGDGSFFSKRLAGLRKASVLYHTRLETDRACVLGMLSTWSSMIETHSCDDDFESSVAGSWSDSEHGAVLHRCPTRLASFSWRAFSLGQGLCLPPDDGHLAEWEHNLAGVVTFTHHPHSLFARTIPHRRLMSHMVQTFSGGFLTCGSIMEGVDISLSESWNGTDSAVHQIVFAALPDGHTAVGLQFCRMGNRRGYLSEVKGLQLNIPNDLYNDYERKLQTECGEMRFKSPVANRQVLGLGGQWVGIEEKIGVVGLYGADEMILHRSPGRRGGALQSLFVEEICYPYLEDRRVEAGEIVLDAGWMVLSGVKSEEVEKVNIAHKEAFLPVGNEHVRAVCVTGRNSRKYCLVANFGSEVVCLPWENWRWNLRLGAVEERDDSSKLSYPPMLEIPPGQARLFLGESLA